MKMFIFYYNLLIIQYITSFNTSSKFAWKEYLTAYSQMADKKALQ